MRQLELWSTEETLECTGAAHAHAAIALSYLQADRTERTRTAYATDWRSFEHWCSEQGACPLPASTGTLARYLGHLAANGRKASTIRRARIAIGVLHNQQGLPRPDRDVRIRSVEVGVARVQGSAEEGAPPLPLSDLERMMRALGSTLRDERDRALLLLGFAGAFRSSELVALDTSDILSTRDGLRVGVRARREESFTKREYTEILRAQNPILCAVSALEHWLKRLPDVNGALFRSVYGSRVTSERLAPRAVSRAVQRAAARAQLTTEYSSHSLRSGLATSAHAQGRSARDIQVHGRWKDSRSLDRYLSASPAAARNVLL